jgi:hypothetical protein
MENRRRHRRFKPLFFEQVKEDLARAKTGDR